MMPTNNPQNNEYSTGETALPQLALPPSTASFYRSPRSWENHLRDRKREFTIYARLANARHHHEPEIKFCVFATARSGSTLLLDLINTHTEVQCEPDARNTELLRGRILWPRRYLESCAKMGLGKAYGFKLLPEHLALNNVRSPQHFISGLQAGGWKIIYLTRRNLFRQALSLALAKQTQVWHLMRQHQKPISCTENNPRTLKTVAVNIDLLTENLDHISAQLHFTDRIMGATPHLKMQYEADLLTAAQQTEAMTRLYAFLGLPLLAGSTPPRFKRIAQDDWRAGLENPNEVEAAVRGTRYEQFLDAP